jgi:hypothetical protein
MTKKERAVIAVARWINKNDREVKPNVAIGKAEDLVDLICAGIRASEVLPFYNQCKGVIK